MPVLMLTAMSSTENRISGLENGADDYLVKPFQPKEFFTNKKYFKEKFIYNRK